MAKIHKVIDRLQGRLQRALPKRLPDQPTDPQDGMSMPAAASKDTAFRLTGLLTLGIATMVLVFAGLLGLQLYKVLGMGDNAPKNIPLVYLKGNGTLRYINQLMETPATLATGVELTSHGAVSDQKAFLLSEDDKQLLYMQQLGGDYGQLWLTTTPWSISPSPDTLNPGVMLADQVLVGSAIFLPKDGGILYQRTDGGDRTSTNLCRWTRQGGEEVLDIYLADSYQQLENGNIAYVKKQDNTTSQLTVLELPPKAGQLSVIHVVDSGRIDIQKVDGNTLYYSSTKGKTFDLMRWEGAAPVQVAEQVTNVLDIGPRGEVFYLRQTSKNFDPNQFFEDDFYLETKNLWGKVTKTFDQTAYDAAVEAYAQKQKRDEIRVVIQQQRHQYTTYVLCHTTGSSSTVVDTGIRAVVTGDATAATSVYYKERSTIAEKFRISAITDPQEVHKQVQTVLSNTQRDYYYAQLGTEPNLFQSISPATEQMEVLLDGSRGLYTLRGAVEGQAPTKGTMATGGTLFYAAVEQGELSGAKKVDDKVYRFCTQTYQEQPLYQKLSGDATVDLYSVQAGKKMGLAVGLPKSLNDNAAFSVHGTTVMGYNSYHEGRLTGTLMQDKNRRRVVGEAVHDYSYRTDRYIYLINNYDAVAGTGDLWLYTGNANKLRFIDSNVAIMTMGLGYRLQEQQ